LERKPNSSHLFEVTRPRLTPGAFAVSGVEHRSKMMEPDVLIGLGLRPPVQPIPLGTTSSTFNAKRIGRSRVALK
jgi:hypothetical protein